MTAVAGWRALARLALRRDRVILPSWVLLLGAAVALVASSYAGLYDTAASRASFARGAAGNPATLALYGRIYGDSLGALTAWRVGGITPVLVAVMSFQAVVRHTRADEEAGRGELLGAGVVGRFAPLWSALVVALAANAALAAVVVLALAVSGLPLGGSAMLVLSLAGTGIAFAGVGAVTAQVVESARAANALAGAVLGLAYLVRAAGDAAGAHWLAWLSPLGWGPLSRPFAGDRAWILLLPAVLAVVAAAAAARLTLRRDHGAGLLPVRPGPARGGLHSALSLAWRLQRTALVGWTAGFALFGIALGAIASSIGDLVQDNPGVEEFLADLGGHQGVVDAYLATMTAYAGLVAGGYAIQALLRPRGEEVAGRAEPVLATAVGRIRWAGGHVAVAAAGTVVLLAAYGLAAGVAHALRTGDGAQVSRMLGAALAQVPAVWVIAGIALALYGLAPRAAAAAWGVLAAFLLLDQLGPLLDLGAWATDLDPFGHVPALPGSEVAAGPLLGLLAVAAALAAAGFVGLHRRDMQ